MNKDIVDYAIYKLTQLKQLGSEIEIFVSSELESIDNFAFYQKDYNDLSTILGIILDNMIESIKETKDKLDWFIIPLTEETPYIEFDNYKDDITVNRDNRFINVKFVVDRKSR